MESDTGTFKEIKTYSRLSKTTKSYQAAPKLHITETLSSKEAIRFLLDGTLRLRVCRYCLNIANNLSDLDEIIVLAGKCGLYEVTIKDIIATFYPVKITYDANFPNKICKTCLDKALQSYFFTQQCEQVERALRNYFEDLNEKFYKLDPVEPIKRRGKRKINPNHNVLYTEYKNVIDYAEPIMNLINLNALPTSSENNELECPKCWQVLPNQTSLVNHEKSHPKTMWYHCKQCGKAFVKYSQLKKHKRQAHLEQTQSIQSDVIFTCKQCGVTNNLLGQHLLHIEKHRFTQTLDDLIMNKKGNCAICFDKGVNMTSLNEPMCLHGGSAGLTGEKSILSIVSTVFPDRSYKYRELIIPTRASKLRIEKRKTETLESTVKKVKYTLENIGIQNITIEEVKNFVFSKPEAIRFILPDYKAGNTMVFNGGIDNMNVVIPRPDYDIDGNEKDDVFPIQPFKEIMPSESDQGESKSDNNLTDIPPEVAIEKNLLDNNDEADKVVRSCKICWIFKQPTCTSCKNATQNEINQTIDEKNDNGKPEVKNKCDFCYIFSEVGFCDFCKNTLRIENNDDTKKKNSDLKLDELTSKSTEWQCNVCLTKNSNRETCICCDEKRILNKDVKVVFNKDNIFLLSNTFKDNIENTHSLLAHTEEKKNFSIDKVKDESNEDETYNPEGNVSKEHDLYTRFTNFNKELDTEHKSTNGMCPMEIEVEPNIANEELMDVTFGDEILFTENMQNTLKNNTMNSNDTDTMETEKMFQYEVKNYNASSRNEMWNPQRNNVGVTFNIGVGDIERKRKKPIRRVSAFRK